MYMLKIIKESLFINHIEYIIVGCSVKGNDKFQNQDFWHVLQGGNSIVVSLADGLGSSVFSKEGAELAVKIMSQTIENSADLDIVADEFLSQWKNEIKSNYNLYDTTIRFIKVTEHYIYYGGIGDGWTGIKYDNRYVHERFDHVFSNQTDSILTLGFKEKFKINYLFTNNIQVVLLATDGFSEDIDEGLQNDLLDKFAEWVKQDVDSFIENLGDYLSNWPISSNTDDKTVILIIKKEE